MKIRKRLLGLALCLCAAACVLCVGASAEEAHSHPICGTAHKDIGDHTGTCEDVTWTPWDGTSAIDYGESNTAYVYLSGEAMREDTFVVQEEHTLYLCLNGHSITKTTDDTDNIGDTAVIEVRGKGILALCNCKETGTITHSSGESGRGVAVARWSHEAPATFIMYGGTISGNNCVSDGGGVCLKGAFIMYGGTISNNKATSNGGGGMYVTGSKFAMYGGTISGNETTGEAENGGRSGGGALIIAQSVIMNGGTISGNKAAGSGGGIEIANYGAQLSGVTISGNTADGNGGGVYFYCGGWNPLTISGSTRIENNSAADGGGIYAYGDQYSSSTLIATGGSIINNNATGVGGGVHFNGGTGNNEFQISGAVNITGNVRGGTIASSGLTGGTDNNVYLSNNKYITVANPLTGPVIGVTTEAAPSDSAYVRIAMGHKLCATPDKFHYENDDTSISAVTSGNTATLVACVHNWSGTWSTDDSNHWHECSICKGKTDVAVHAYDQEVVNEIYKASGATCTAKATYYKSCVCGRASTTDTFESGDKDPTNHTGTEEWVKTATTHEKKWNCCGAVKTTEAGHSFGAWNDSKRSCTVCGYEETCAHTGGIATCTTKAVCEVCGTAYGELDASNHDWGEWAVTTPATTSTTGVETRTCKWDASHTETRDIPKLTPAPSGGSSTPTITVPVTGSRDTVQVSASVSGSTAEVKEVKKAELDKIGTDRDVVIDLSGLSKSVTGVTLPIDTIRGIAESEADGVTIKLPQAELRVDQQTLAAVSEQAKGSKVQLVVETDSKAKITMTAAQKSALDGMKNAAALEAYFVSNGTRIRDFNGGEVELSVPYQASGAIRAWYLKEDGAREPVSARYDKENARLILRHFSHYVIEELDSSTAYTVCAKDNTCPLAAFGDLTATAWYHDGVHYCLENGLMQGVSTARFLPDGSTTRAQLVTILWRLEGSPETTGAVSFGDVADSAWYAKAVRWAAGSGVVKGYDSERFGPDDAVTREQMVTILYRCAQYKGADVSVGEDTNILSFNDALTVSEYAIPAMQWACGSGLVTGIAREGGTFLAPADTTVRVQTATLMMRFPGALVKTV